MKITHASSILALGFVLSACPPVVQTTDAGDAARDTSTTTDTGNTPADTGTSDASAPALPTPSEWQGLGNPTANVTYALDRPNMTTQAGDGTSMLGLAPTGAPANSSVLTFTWTNILGSMTDADCRIGLIYNSGSGSYTFSADPLLTQTCTFGTAGSAMGTFTFTGATVRRQPILNNLQVIINTTVAGTVGAASGTITITWP